MTKHLTEGLKGRGFIVVHYLRDYSPSPGQGRQTITGSGQMTKQQDCEESDRSGSTAREAGRHECWFLAFISHFHFHYPRAPTFTVRWETSLGAPRHAQTVSCR